MKQTLKVTNVLSDPTRFEIYQYLIKSHESVGVAHIADIFDIHPNVARLHLSKLEDVHLINSFAEKTGKGGRPSRKYHLSNKVVELNFPHRDYKLLSSIAISSFVELGATGQKALYKTGRRYGTEIVERHQQKLNHLELTIDDKIDLLSEAGTMLGMYPDFSYDEKSNSISFKINNCPFKEVARQNHEMVCHMHNSFIKGMFEALFDNVTLEEHNNMFQGCENCTYIAKVSNN